MSIHKDHYRCSVIIPHGMDGGDNVLEIINLIRKIK